MNLFETIEADAKIAIDEVKKGLTFLEHEGEVILTWVEKEVPGAAGAIAVFLKEAEASASSLSKIGGNGLQSEIKNGLDDMETWLLNFINNSGLSKNTKAGLAAIDVSAVTLVQTIGKSAVDAALAGLLAKLTPAP